MSRSDADAKFRIGLAQVAASDDLEANLRRGLQWVDQAAEQEEGPITDDAPRTQRPTVTMTATGTGAIPRIPVQTHRRRRDVRADRVGHGPGRR